MLKSASVLHFDWPPSKHFLSWVLAPRLAAHGNCRDDAVAAEIIVCRTNDVRRCRTQAYKMSDSSIMMRESVKVLETAGVVD